MIIIRVISIIAVMIMIYEIHKSVNTNDTELLQAINEDKTIICKQKGMIARYPKQHIINFDNTYITFYINEKMYIFKHNQCEIKGE